MRVGTSALLPGHGAYAERRRPPSSTSTVPCDRYAREAVVASPSSTPRLAAGIGHDGSSRTRHRPHRPSAQATCRRRATARRLHRSRRPRGRFPRRRAAHLCSRSVGSRGRPGHLRMATIPQSGPALYPAVTRAEVLRAQRFSKAWPMGARAEITHRGPAIAGRFATAIPKGRPSRAAAPGAPREVQNASFRRLGAVTNANGSPSGAPSFSPTRLASTAVQRSISSSTLRHLRAGQPPRVVAVGRAARSRAREVRHPARRAGEPGLPTIRCATASRPRRAGLPLQRVPPGQVAPQRAVPRAAPRGDCRKTARTSEQAAGGAYGVRDRRCLLLPRRLQSKTVACADRREQAADRPRHVRHQGRSCGRSGGRRTRTPRT